MKYRMLTDDELPLFEEDLKQFLIVHGVHSEEWAKMNQEHPAEARKLVELFSDTVLQKVYEKIKFIEHRSKSSCMVFHLKPESIEMISINAKSDSVDLSSPEGIHDALVNHTSELTFFKNTKTYAKERELEIHEMLGQGCVNSSEAFWMQLEKALF
jgi:predicted Zn-ribbon and HTH transcriptional regulator